MIFGTIQHIVVKKFFTTRQSAKGKKTRTFSQCVFFGVFRYILCAGGDMMKEKEDKTPIPWEMKDPKPPVVRSGHMEGRVQHKDG